MPTIGQRPANDAGAGQLRIAAAGSGVWSITSLRPQMIAALTAVCIMAPECVAFAQLAGIPPERGLVVAPVLIAAYALFGGSRYLYITPLAATALLTAVTVSDLNLEADQRVAATAAVALTAGAILLVTGLARCGFIVHFLRPEAITGFLFGLAVVVIVRELGIAADVDLGDGSAAERTVRLFSGFQDWHLPSIGFATVAFVLILILERWRPSLPSTLLVLAAAWFLTVTAGLYGRGFAVVGPIPATFPTLSLPDLNGSGWVNIIGGSLGLALICFVLSYGVATRVADPSAPPLNANREMLALGISNISAGLVGGLAGAGSPETSPAAKAVGGSRRWSLLLAAALMFALTGWGTRVFENLPEAALAAVVIAAIRGFTAPEPFIQAWQRDRPGFAVAVCAAIGVIALGLLMGLLIAVALSFVLFVARASRIHVSELGQAPGTATYLAVERFPDLVRHHGVVILRPDGELFFANIDRAVADVQQAVRSAQPAPTHLLLDLSASFHLDQPTINALTRLRHVLSEQSVELHFLHLYLAAADAIGDSSLADVPTHRDTSEATHELVDGVDASGASSAQLRPLA